MDYKTISITLFEQDEAKLEVVLSWVKAHPNDSMSEAMLANANICRHLSALNRSYILGQRFLREPPAS